MPYIVYKKKKTDELFHHGILGQKWGVRRFQNEDGTYTSAGKKRYNVADKLYRSKTAFKETWNEEAPHSKEQLIKKEAALTRALDNLLEVEGEVGVYRKDKFTKSEKAKLKRAKDAANKALDEAADKSIVSYKKDGVALIKATKSFVDEILK